LPTEHGERADPVRTALEVYLWYRILRACVTLIFRFFAGRPLDGKARTRCDFLHRSDEAITVSRRASSWARMAGWERAYYRVLVLAMLVGTLWGWIFWWHTAVVVGWLLVAAVYLGYLGTQTGTWWRTRSVRRTVINPLAAALSRTVGQANAKRATDWVHVNADRTVTVDLPEHFEPTPEGMEKVDTISAAKLGAEQESTYHVAGSMPTVVLEVAPPPPASVPWQAVQPFLSRQPGEVLLGIGSRDPYWLNFRGDTPHVYTSIPNNLGKTNIARVFGCQILHDGGRTIILDSVKKQSHKWAWNLPGVTYCSDAEASHWAILKLQNEMAQRYLSPDPEQLPQIVLIVEDALGTADQLQAIWHTQLGKGSGMLRSPAVLALQEIFTAGRQCNINVALFAQKAIATAFGGSNGAAARENAIPILHSMSSPATWELITGITKPPPQTPHQGRVWTVNAGIAYPIQVPMITDQEARIWATNGIPQPPPPPEVEDLPGWLSESPATADA
jgi:hypothetical protein